MKAMLFYSDAGKALTLINTMFIDQAIQINQVEFFASCAVVLAMPHHIKSFALSMNIDPAGLATIEILALILLGGIQKLETKGVKLRQRIEELELQHTQSLAKLRKVREATDAAAEIQELHGVLSGRELQLKSLRIRLAKTESLLEQSRFGKVARKHRYPTRISGGLVDVDN